MKSAIIACCSDIVAPSLALQGTRIGRYIVNSPSIAVAAAIRSKSRVAAVVGKF